MFNLLPTKDKILVRNEYSRRRLVVALVLIALTFFVGVLTLVPPHVIAWYKLREIKKTEEYLSASIPTKNKDDFKSIIELTNAKISALSASGTADMTILLSDITSNRQQNIAITQLSFKTDTKGKLTANLRGVARTRDDLMKFVEDLRNNKLYSKVDFPVSSFAKEYDIEFGLVLTGA